MSKNNVLVFGAILILCTLSFLLIMKTFQRPIVIDAPETHMSTNASSRFQMPNDASVVLLPVIPLPTSGGVQTKHGLIEADDFVYPHEVPVVIPKKYADQVALYGGARKLWLGPKDWQGNAHLTDLITIQLSPKNKTDDFSSLNYDMFSACEDCAFGVVSQFFPEMTQVTWEKKLKNLVVTRLSPTVVSYHYTNEHGMTTYGAAQYTPESQIMTLQKGEISLPQSQSDLAQYIQQFILDSLLKGVGIDVSASNIVVPTSPVNQMGEK